MTSDRLERSFCGNFTLVDEDNSVDILIFEDMQVVGDHHSSLSFPEVAEQILKDSLAHVGIQSTQAVVDEVDVRLRVDGSSDQHSLLLSSRQIDASFSDFGLLTSWQFLQVLR